MRIVTATVGKRGLLGRRAISPAVQSLIALALKHPPWGSSGTSRRDSWTSASGDVRIDAVSNESGDVPLIVDWRGRRATAWTGYIDGAAFDGSPPDPAVVADSPGCFALTTAADHEAIGFTSVHRMEPLYVAEGRQVLVLSNSARVAHQVAQIPDSQPPLAALVGLSGPGFMLNDETPFPGVTAVPAGAYVTLTAAGKVVRSLPAPDVDVDSPLTSVVDRVTEALTTSAELIGSALWERTVQLTGGKDSRLAAAVLTSAGVDYVATTTGVPTHPDVLLGGRVARLLGVPHEIQPPVGAVREGGAVEVRPVERAYSVLRGCEGMLSAYETITLNGPYQEQSVRLGGHGGELLRGGYAYGVPPGPTTQVLRRLKWAIEPHRNLLSEGARAELDRIAEPWRELLAADPHRGSEQLYRVVRNGRWHAVANSVYSIKGPRRSLLADNRVVRIASAARQDLAAEERIIHAVIHRLQPNLCAVPLYPKRWNFERTEPAADCDAAGWARRTPPAADHRQAWNWKASYPPELHRHFADVILGAPLYDWLLDRPQVEEFLTGTAEERAPAQATRVWNLYTVSQLVAGLGSRPAEPEGPVFRIPIPKA
jgi:hypothetical protein